MEETKTALKALRLSAMAGVLETRYQEAKANELDYLDFVKNLIQDELTKGRIIF